MVDDADAALSVCYLTTRGRVTGRPHTVEIWFAADGDTLYLLFGGGRRADWVRNLRADPSVGVRLAGRDRRGRARVVTGRDERRRAAHLVWSKYRGGYGGDLTAWRDGSLAVAVELDPT